MTGTVHSLVIFLIPYFVYTNSITRKNGFNSDLWEFSITSFTAIIIVTSIVCFNLLL